MICLGLIICFLSLVSAVAYAANGSMLSLCMAFALLAIGTGLVIPAAGRMEETNHDK